MKFSSWNRKSILVQGAALFALLAVSGGVLLNRRTPNPAPVSRSAQPLHPHVLHASWPQAGSSSLTVAQIDDLYQDKCALCHGADRTGNPPAFPTLIGVGAKYTDAEITGQIRHGKGRMPAFASLTEEEVKALVAYIKAPAKPATVPPADAAGYTLRARGAQSSS